MKLDQVCFYVHDEAGVDHIKALFGLSNANWIEDTVTARSLVMKDRYGNMEEVQNTGLLLFNYDLGIELEILRYTGMDNWHDRRNPLVIHDALVSHVGIHLRDDEEFPEMPGCKLVQETFTHTHTNEYVNSARRNYHYKIWELSPGSYIKHIKRVHLEASDVAKG